MSYDLALWSSHTSVRKPLELWNALYIGAKHVRELAGAPVLPDTRTSTLSYDEAKALVSPLKLADIVVAFRKEFGTDLLIGSATELGTQVSGVGWDFMLADGDYYVHVGCRWGLANDQAALTRIKRAALRARCSTYDLQTDTLFEPT